MGGPHGGTRVSREGGTAPLLGAPPATPSGMTCARQRGWGRDGVGGSPLPAPLLCEGPTGVPRMSPGAGAVFAPRCLLPELTGKNRLLQDKVPVCAGELPVSKVYWQEAVYCNLLERDDFYNIWADCK